MVKLTKIIKQLMADKQINAAELARRTQLPQPTVHRIVTGATTMPHKGSLQSIADFFNVTEDQLRGLEPIPNLSVEFESTSSNNTFKNVPILSWPQARNWQHYTDSEQASEQEYLLTDAVVSQHAFALIMQDASMEPQIALNSKLIIDPDKKTHDRSFILVYLNNSNSTVLRQLIIDANQHFIKALSPELSQAPLIELTEQDSYLGMLMQIRYDYS